MSDKKITPLQYQSIFEYLHDQFGIAANNSDIDDLIEYMGKVQAASQPPTVKGAVWILGQYDRLYEQVQSGTRTVCYVDYNSWGTETVFRDICTIKAETMEFSSRGHGYGTAKYMSGNEKKLFIELCESIKVTWLDESPTAAGDGKFPWGPDEYPNLSDATNEQKTEVLIGLVQVAAKEIMRMFYAFGLKTHIECTVVNDPTNESFDFIFRKKGAGDGKEAIEFKKWTMTDGCRYFWLREDEFVNMDNPKEKATTAQLYDIFKNKNDANK